MIERELLEDELRKVTELECMYRECMEMVKPASMDENPAPLARVYMMGIRGVERCVEMRMKIIREMALMPEDLHEEQMMDIDLSKLSDQALREVEMALTPEVNSGNGQEIESEQNSEVCEKQQKKRKIPPRTKAVRTTKQSQTEVQIKHET